MLVDPEYVHDYLELPLMNRITYMMSCSIRDVVSNATNGHIALCSLISLERDGSIVIYTPMNGLDIYSFRAEQAACPEEYDEYIALEVNAELIQRAKRNEYEQDEEPLYPIGEVKFLSEVDEKKLYWCPISPMENAPIYSNELFIRLCDEFGRKWGDFLAKNDIKRYNEFWDETSRRILGTPTLFIEYVASLVLSDHFHLEDYENDGVNLLTYINILSSQPYEGRSCKGMICLLKKNIQNYSMLLTFEKEEHILERPVRENRKLIEMTDDQHALIIQEGYILGIGNKELGDERIHFLGNSNWTFSDAEENVVFRCETGNIRITGKADNSFVYSMLTDQFGTDCDAQIITNLISVASKQKHGTGIVIIDDAEHEANRLHEAGRDILIKPIFLGNHIESVSAITRIDGALIIDPYGTCYAIGAIVDGESVIEGSPARGARYNSLANYVAWQQSIKKKCLAVVVSEDGTIDIVLSSEEMNDKWIGNG